MIIVLKDVMVKLKIFKLYNIELLSCCSASITILMAPFTAQHLKMLPKINRCSLDRKEDILIISITMGHRNTERRTVQGAELKNAWAFVR